jgi:small-conductance mechanosensitive channel
MRMYEGTLSASFDMEEEYDRAITKLQEEIELLEEKNKKLQVDIRDDIAQLLERRRSLLELKDKRRIAGIAHDRTSAKMEVAMDCKEALEARWKKVTEMGKLA